MIGLGEILLAIVSFSIIWFLIFKIKMMHDVKKILENIEEKIEKQTGNLFTKEAKQDLKGKLGLEENQVKNVEEKKSIINYYLGLFKRKK